MEHIVRDLVTGEYVKCGFDNVKFPTDVSYGAVTITKETIEAGDNYPLQYNVSQGVKTQAQLQALIDFFRARKGRGRCFWFKDWVTQRWVLVRFATDRISASLDNYGSHSWHDIPLHEVELYECKMSSLEKPEY